MRNLQMGTSMSSSLLTHPPPPTITTSASCFWWKHVIWASLQLTSSITKYCAQLPFLGRQQEIGWRKHPNTQNMVLGCFRRYAWRVQMHSQEVFGCPGIDTPKFGLEKVCPCKHALVGYIHAWFQECKAFKIFEHPRKLKPMEAEVHFKILANRE